MAASTLGGRSMVDCDVRTHQKRSVIVASAQSLPPPPFAMGNCFVPMGTRSRLLPPAPSCRQQGDARWTAALCCLACEQSMPASCHGHHCLCLHARVCDWSVRSWWRVSRQPRRCNQGVHGSREHGRPCTESEGAEHVARHIWQWPTAHQSVKAVSSDCVDVRRTEHGRP